jgi:PAS domain S-box-containing protein
MSDRHDDEKSKTDRPIHDQLEQLGNLIGRLSTADRQLKESQQALFESEERYRTLVEASPIPIFIHTEEIIVFINDEAIHALGAKSKSELIGKSLWDLIPPESVEMIKNRVDDIYGKKRATQLADTKFLRVDGKPIDVEVMGSIIDYKGKPASHVVFRDITARKEAERATQLRIRLEHIVNQISMRLMSSDSRYIKDAVQGAIQTIGEHFDVDRSYVFLFSDDLERLSNTYAWVRDGIHHPIEELQNLSTSHFPWWMERIKKQDYIHIPDVSLLPDDASVERSLFRDQQIKSMMSVALNSRNKLLGFMGFDAVRHKKKWNEADIGLMRTVAYMIVSAMERQNAYDALNIQNTFLEELFQCSPDAIVILDHQDRVLRINREFESLFGYTEPEAIGKQINNLIVPEELEKEATYFTSQVADNKNVDVESVRCSRSGEKIDVSIRGKPFEYGVGQRAVFAMYRDIRKIKQSEADKQKLEEQLRQAQKMEAIGSLAGGIAHDFNNVLGVIIGYAELTGDDLEDGAQAKANIRHILSAADRAKEMVMQILAFSRKDERKRIPLLLEEIVVEALKLLRSTLPTYIDIRTNISDSAKGQPILGNPTQVHQVIMNICTNAAHSMMDKGGLLEVAIREIVMDDFTLGQKTLRPGRYLQLSFSDTGCGMKPEVLERVFEPYFTTKKTGEGTGMGMAVVHGIIKSHGGDITVYSEPNKGTTFHIFLPVTDQDVPSQGAEPEPILGGSGRILLVDDDTGLLEMEKLMLETLGYQVVAHSNSLNALEVFDADPEFFDMVITDQTMPNKTGDQLAHHIKSIRPDIPMILCTGFSERINEENFKYKGIDAFMMKPIVKKEISRIVYKLLNPENSNN